MPRARIPHRRSRLLDAARDLALAEGWDSTTVSAIAARAGVGKGAVYLEFADKDAILSAALERSARDVTRAVHAGVLRAAAVVDLPTVYGIAVEALLDDPLMRSATLGDQRVLGDHVRRIDDGRYQDRFDWLVDYVRGLQGAGVIAADVDAQIVVRILSTFTLGLVHAPGTLEATGEEELRATVGLFASLVGRGLAGTAAVDPAAARSAQLALLERLDDQLASVSGED